MLSSSPPSNPAACASTSRWLRRAGWPGTAVGASYLLIVLGVLCLATAPGRLATVWYDQLDTPIASPLRWTLAAVWRDLCESAWFFVGIAAVGLLLVNLGVLFVRKKSATTVSINLLLGILAVIATCAWLMSIAFCEIWIQRGTLPVWHDLKMAMDADFARSAVSNFLAPRYWVTGLGSLLVVGLVVKRWRSWAARKTHGMGTFTLGFVLATTLFFATTQPVHNPIIPLPRWLIDVPGLTSPFGRFLGSVARAAAGQSSDPRVILSENSLPPDLEPAGAALLGLSHRPDDSTMDCTKHPWATPFPFDPNTGGGLRRAGKGAKLTKLLQELSSALFPAPDKDETGTHGQVAVFQLSLESFRGDDLAALNPAASPLIAPFLDTLYTDADAGTGKHAVIASRDLWQAGVRTSQGMSAFTCGLGTLPHGLSMARDLGTVPLRCLPDILSDAGFTLAFAYGSHTKFDRMGKFLSEHGYGPMLTLETLPKHLPRGEWGGFSDLAVSDQLVRFTASAKGDLPIFALMMTLSNHSPFQPPEDLPDHINDRVKQALKERPNLVRPEDRARLVTFSYTDAVVETFFEHLRSSGLADRSIVILHADHATGERFVWPRPDGGDPRTGPAKGRIPFAIVLPEELVERSADPERVRSLARDVHIAINEFPLSLNDVPLLTLNLLSQHPGVRSISPRWRWHSMGAMALSDAFSGNVDGPRLIGINGINQLFFLDRHDDAVFHVETVLSLTSPDEMFLGTRPLYPATALLGSFLRGYGTRCQSATLRVQP